MSTTQPLTFSVSPSTDAGAVGVSVVGIVDGALPFAVAAGFMPIRTASPMSGRVRLEASGFSRSTFGLPSILLIGSLRPTMVPQSRRRNR
jgi:hypothetical protein